MRNKFGYIQKTIDDAHWFASTINLDRQLYVDKNQEEIYYLKLANELKKIESFRAAGRCYMQALWHSIQNYAKAQTSDDFCCISNYEKIYKITIGFYASIGSTNYIKEINKTYRKWVSKEYMYAYYGDVIKEFEHICQVRETLEKYFPYKSWNDQSLYEESTDSNTAL